MIIENMDSNDITEILKKFYTDSIIDSVYFDFKKYPFNNLYIESKKSKNKDSFQLKEEELYFKIKNLLNKKL